MLGIRCNDSEKEIINVLLKSFKKDDRKKNNVDIIIDALKVYEEYRTKVKAKIEQAVKDVWGKE